MRHRRGFTLRELLVTLIIVSILATMAVMRYSRTMEKAYRTAMQSDLRTLVAAQELFRSDSARYAADVTQLAMRRTSPQVRVSITQADARTWTATAMQARPPWSARPRAGWARQRGGLGEVR